MASAERRSPVELVAPSSLARRGCVPPWLARIPVERCSAVP